MGYNGGDHFNMQPRGGKGKAFIVAGDLQR
jgi:hypothetical protein